jgi:cardiolipin synthase
MRRPSGLLPAQDERDGRSSGERNRSAESRRPMQRTRDDVLTVPNLLTFYRLAMVPIIVALALYEQRTSFVTLLVVSFVTDVLDGLIARTWNMCTRLGARLDSIADVLTYVAAVIGIFRFEYQTLEPHIALLYAFLAALAAATLIPLAKFRTTPSFHLYSFKANALLQAVFLFCLFVFGFNVYFYYFVMIFGIVACLELIAVALVVDRPVSDARGLFWVLNERKRGR